MVLLKRSSAYAFCLRVNRGIVHLKNSRPHNQKMHLFTKSQGIRAYLKQGPPVCKVHDQNCFQFNAICVRCYVLLIQMLPDSTHTLPNFKLKSFTDVKKNLLLKLTLPSLPFFTAVKTIISKGTEKISSFK